MNRTKKIIWGAVLIAVGVLLALRGLNIINFSLFFDGWWAALIIIVFGIGLITERDKLSCLIGVIIGVFLFLCCRGILEFSMIWKLIVPVIIFVIGIKLIVGAVRGDKANRMIDNMRTDGKHPKRERASFGSVNVAYVGEVFEGGEFNSEFGALRCDLRGTIIENDCAVRASAVFGGIELYVPDNVTVKVNSNSIFGAVSNSKNKSQGQHTLYINANAVFGGIDIK